MFQKQLMMRRVLISLVPIFLFSLYLYGVRTLSVFAVTFVLGILTEYFIEKQRGKKVSEAVLVTCSLYAFSMPPAVPLWIVAVGIVFAVFMAKEVYGGFGRNVFNPAIAGRLFVYISFATIMQASFVPPGNFGLPMDAVTGPTPLALMRTGEHFSPLALLVGLRPGSIGESSSILIILAAVYLIATKTASWRIIASTFVSGAILAGALFFAGVKQALPMESLLAGSFLFVVVFMATDPVSAPKKNGAQWAYGAIIGSCIVLVRSFSLFPEGTSFGVFIGNTAACMLDDIAAKFKKKKEPVPVSVAKEGTK
ncbi:MAG: RnfABCDGE type electron transport complex subunit D [Treponemataceae bacterium]